MSLYANNDHKFVAVLNRKEELPKLLNALGHISAGITAQHDDVPGMKFLDYEDADGGSHPGISHYPYIVLAARNGNQIRTLRQAAIDGDITYTDFADSMLGQSAEDQLNRTKQTSEEELNYLAIALFGPADKLDPLTKKFSLFKAT